MCKDTHIQGSALPLTTWLCAGTAGKTHSGTNLKAQGRLLAQVRKGSLVCGRSAHRRVLCQRGLHAYLHATLAALTGDGRAIAALCLLLCLHSHEHCHRGCC